MYPFSYSSPSSPPHSVDCTLSLATPSTRISQDEDHLRRFTTWDFFQSEAAPHQPTHPNVHADNHPARRCANCHTPSTPLWRNGPRGPKSLCNACGIRYKKEERRANSSSHRGSASTARIDRNWGQQQNTSYFSPAPGFQFSGDDDDRNSEQLTAYRWFGGGY